MALTIPNEIEKIKTRIRALLEMTTKNGATEAEALSATNKVNELLQQYDLSFSDVSTGTEYINTEKYGIRRVVLVFNDANTVRKFWHESKNVAGPVGRFFGCEVWIHSPHVCFFGTEFDTYNAKNLLMSMTMAFDNSWAAFKASPEYASQQIHGKAMRADFMHAMAHRINVRLFELKLARDANVVKQSPSAGALVIIKTNEVERRYNEMLKDSGLTFKPQGQPKPVREYKSGVATMAGIRAGNAADLGTVAQKRFEKSPKRLK